MRSLRPSSPSPTKYRFRLTAGNGPLVATGEACETKAAEEGSESLDAPPTKHRPSKSQPDRRQTINSSSPLPEIQKVSC